MVQLFCGVTGLINFITCLALAVFLYFKNRSGKINILFAIWSASVAFWSFGYFMWLFTEKYSTALFWTRILMSGAIVIPSAYLHFTIVYLNLDHRHRLLIIFGYLFSGLYLILNWTPLFIATVEPRYWFRWWPVPGKLYHIYQAYFILAVIYTHFLLFQRAYTAPTKVLRKQFKLVAYGTLIAYIGGSTNFFLWYNIPIPPVFNFMVTGYVALIAYAILQYKLWDLDFIVRKTIVFSGVFGFFVFVFFSITYLLNLLIGSYVGLRSNAAAIMTFAAGIIFYGRVEKFFITATDRFLFQKKEDILVVLRELSHEIITILDLHTLSSKILSTLEHTLRPETAILLIQNEQKKEFEVASSYGVAISSETNKKIDSLVHYLSDYSELINLEEEKRKEVLPVLVLTALEELKAVITIPLVMQNKLQGILLLGKKKSDQSYEARELDAFPALAGQIAVAVSNTKLLDEIVVERTAKKEAEKKAELVNYTRTFKHEGGNALVGIESAAISMRSHFLDKSEKLRKQFEPLLTPTYITQYDQLNASVAKCLKSIEEEGSKMGMIMNTVVGGLSGSETEKQMIYFRIPWETAKRNAGIEYNFRFMAQIEDNFKMYGNVNAVERLFTNLFTNSRDALENQKEKLIYLNAVYRDYEGKKVTWFEYWDAGSGVPEPLFEKVFEQGFSTKLKPQSSTSSESGHGYGLYVCRKYIEDIHGGKIWIEKREEGGSKFVFWIPCQDA